MARTVGIDRWNFMNGLIMDDYFWYMLLPIEHKMWLTRLLNL